jgi:hypothetical protein
MFVLRHDDPKCKPPWSYRRRAVRNKLSFEVAPPVEIEGRRSDRFQLLLAVRGRFDQILSCIDAMRRLISWEDLPTRLNNPPRCPNSHPYVGSAARG